jgi:queuine/archaeosine tRNA-ribosyltransferase
MCEHGNSVVPPREYLEHARVLRPDAISLLCEEARSDNGNKFCERVLKRNLDFVDTCLEEYDSVFDDSYRPPLFASVEGGPNMKLRAHHSRIMASKGTPAWKHHDAPDPTDKAAVKTYNDRAAKNGRTVSRAPDGFVVGGLASAASPEQLAEMLACSVQPLPEAKPRIANVVGDPSEVVALASGGIDLLTASYPLVLTDNGLAMVAPVTADELDEAIRLNAVPAVEAEEKSDGLSSAVSSVVEVPELKHQYLALRNSKYREDARPLVEGCACYACQHHTRAYISHLLNAQEMLGEILLLIHNAHRYGLLFGEIRTQMEQGPEALAGWVAKTKEVYVPHVALLDLSGRKRPKARISRNADE